MHNDFCDGGSRHHHPNPHHGRPPRPVPPHVRPYGEAGFVVGDERPCPFGEGIPGNYMEHIDGVPDEVIVEHAFGSCSDIMCPWSDEPFYDGYDDEPFCDDCNSYDFPGPFCEDDAPFLCGCNGSCKCDGHDEDEASDAPASDGASAESLTDALLRIRLACKALSDMAKLVASETGIDLSVTFLPPYHGVGACDHDREPAEWLLMMDGELAYYESYDKLCELWASGPEAMHDFLTETTSTSSAVRAVLSTVDDIFARGNDGDDEEDSSDVNDDEELPFGGIFALPDDWQPTGDAFDKWLRRQHDHGHHDHDGHHHHHHGHHHHHYGHHHHGHHHHHCHGHHHHHDHHHERHGGHRYK